MTQNEMILNHMQKCNGITSMEAYSLYGCTRLSARIKDLREEGHNIGTIRESSMNRVGKVVSYARYILKNA